MNLHQNRLFVPGLLACLPVAAAPAVSQVPDGWYVVSSFKSTTIPTASSPFPGTGGLFLLHPRRGGAVPVIGLPAELTGAGQTTGFRGANCVTLDRRDGSLWVGQIDSSPNVPIYLYRIYLKGATVDTTRTKRFSVGSAASASVEASISDVVVRPDGTAVLLPFGLSGPTKGAPLATVSPTGAVAPLPLKGAFPGAPNALAIDAGGTELYIGVYETRLRGSVWRVPAKGGTPTQIVGKLQGGVMSMARSADGRLLVGTFGSNGMGGGQNLYVVDPAKRTATPVVAGDSVRNAAVIEDATGSQVIVDTTGGTRRRPLNGIVVRSAAGAQTLLTWGPSSGWGVVSGVDINPDPELYGTGTVTMVNKLEWQIAPMPGGLPHRGHRLGLAVVATPGKGLQGDAWFFLAPSRATVLVGGVRLWLGGGLIGPTPVPWRSSSSSARATLWLNVPSNKNLIGVPVRCQAFAFDAAGISATSGLELSVVH